ncbi:hypothetical protein F4777DRAFT_197603 [Nemania sp. FL0916]|nr:hypothetical protein F4777DRAFT_197603 [Nemania sp. FL0916]
MKSHNYYATLFPPPAAPPPPVPIFSSTTFKPCYMFFYGTLMDPDILQDVTECPTKPVLQPGWITGFKPKMWSIFPTLLPPDDSPPASGPVSEAGQGASVAPGHDSSQEQDDQSSVKVRGMFWKMEKWQYFQKLQKYETTAYRAHWCRVHVGNSDIDTEGGRVLEDCVVFVWARDPQSDELTGGAFDLEYWQGNHRPAHVLSPDINWGD